jgi:septation ring formation regulator EzrA
MITLNREREEKKQEAIIELLDTYQNCVQRDLERIEKWGDICKWDDNDLDLAKTHIDTFKVLSTTIRSILTTD